MSEQKTTADLAPAEYNPRKVVPGAIQRLRKQLAEFGDLGGIVFNRRTGRLVGGHQRIAALQESWPIEKQEITDAAGTVAVGHIDTPHGRLSYREVDWPESKEKLANLAANNSAGQFDNGKVKALLLDLTDMPTELSGFDSSFLEKLLLPADPPEIKEWDLGDIYEPFWLVVRGPISHLHKVRCAIEQAGENLLSVEGNE